MHLTLRQLKLFEAVARHLSFTQAAQQLHLSQPAVSMQLGQLEEGVGLPLFERLGKRIQLTEAGRELLYYSQRITQSLQEAQEVMDALKGCQRGHLRISVATTANHFATRLLAAFIERYPQIGLSLDVTNRKSLLQQLADNSTDLVIMGEPPEDSQLEAWAFMENPLVVIAAPHHPLAASTQRISLKRLAQESFVSREAESGTRAAMARFLSAHGLKLRTSIQVTSNEAIKQAVEAGLGLGVVSIHTLELELETRRLKVLEVEGMPIVRHWYLVQALGKRLSPIAQAFHDFLLGPDAVRLAAQPMTTDQFGAGATPSSAGA